MATREIMDAYDPPLAYLATPIGNVHSPLGRLRAWRRAREAARIGNELLRNNWNVYCPVWNFMHLDVSIPRRRWIEVGLAWLAMADCLILCPGWRDSAGCLTELALSRELDIPAYEYVGGNLIEVPI